MNSYLLNSAIASIEALFVVICDLMAPYANRVMPFQWPGVHLDLVEFLANFCLQIRGLTGHLMPGSPCVWFVSLFLITLCLLIDLESAALLTLSK